MHKESIWVTKEKYGLIAPGNQRNILCFLVEWGDERGQVNNAVGINDRGTFFNGRNEGLTIRVDNPAVINDPDTLF